MLGSTHDPGLIESSINHLFDEIEGMEEKRFLLRVSYMEIYNENVTDLLADVSDLWLTQTYIDDDSSQLNFIGP